MTGDTDKYLGPQDLKELGDDSLPAEGYMGFSLGGRSARYPAFSSYNHFITNTSPVHFLLTCHKLLIPFYFKNRNQVASFTVLLNFILNLVMCLLSSFSFYGGFVMAVTSEQIYCSFLLSACSCSRYVKSDPLERA